MKISGMLSVVALVVSVTITAHSQGIEPEVPGDHFSLEGALELFKKSESPEEFEKKLNSPDSKVNNLDLNADGYIDYIRVLDHSEGNVHAFVLQAVVSESQSQDVAVIELEKLSNGKAVLQIVGNEDIYGVETIIEPTREVRTYGGTTTTRTVVNVWAWPSVQYVYGPYYRGWISPWHWDYHPVWWHHWTPIAYVHYHSYWRPYRPYYAYCPTRRVVYAHHIYHPHRTSSIIVRDRYHSRITQYRQESPDRYRSNDRRSYATAQYARRDRSSVTPRTDLNRSTLDNRSPRRDDQYQGRTPSTNRSATIPAPTRPTTRDRNAAGEFNRNAPRVERSAPESRKPVAVSSNARARQPVTTRPNMDRSREVSSPPQRTINRERSTPAPVQRSTPQYRRSEAPARSNPPAMRQQPSRQTTINRSAPTSRPSPAQRPSRSSDQGSDSRRGRH